MSIAQLLAALRQSQGLSQERLAALLCETSATPTVTREEVSRWERGKRTPSKFWLGWLAVVLDIPLAVLERAKAAAMPQGDVNDQLAYLAAGSVIDSPWSPAGTVDSMAATARGAPMDRRGFLIAGGSALSAIAAAWAGASPTSTALDGDGRRLSTGVLTHLEQRLADLRRLDDAMGGGELRRVALVEFQTLSRLASESSYTDAVGRRLFTLVSEAARIAGWMSFDQGFQSAAQSYFITALRAASTADSAEAGANALACMTIQTYSVGNPHDAVSLASTALDHTADKTTPRVQCALHARTAKALAAAGDRARCASELNKAWDAYSAGTHDDDPPWVYWMTAPELEMTAGASALDVGDPHRALQHLERAGEGYAAANYVRDHALCLIRTAEAHLMLGDLESACATATRALTANGDLDSARPTDAIADLRARLGAYRATAVVRDFLDQTAA